MQVCAELPIRVRGQRAFFMEVSTKEEAIDNVKRLVPACPTAASVRFVADDPSTREFLTSCGAKEVPVGWFEVQCARAEDSEEEATKAQRCSLRALTPEDFEAWREAFLSFQQSQFDFLKLPCPEMPLEELERLFREVLSDALAMGAFEYEKTEALLGVAHLCRGSQESESGPAFLAEFWVVPRAHRTGVGRELFRSIVATMATRGHGCIKFACIESNEGALAFYRSMGAALLPHRCLSIPTDKLDGILGSMHKPEAAEAEMSLDGLPASAVACGRWSAVGAKGECVIFEDHITMKLSYEEELGDGQRLHGWLEGQRKDSGGVTCWEAKVYILEDDEDPWYGPSFGEEPEYEGNLQVRLRPGAPVTLETQIQMDGEEEWSPPVTWHQKSKAGLTPH